MKQYITVTQQIQSENSSTLLVQVPHENLTLGLSFILMSPERINNRLIQMLRVICRIFEFENGGKKFIVIFSLQKRK